MTGMKQMDFGLWVVALEGLRASRETPCHREDRLLHSAPLKEDARNETATSRALDQNSSSSLPMLGNTVRSATSARKATAGSNETFDGEEVHVRLGMAFRSLPQPFFRLPLL